MPSLDRDPLLSTSDATDLGLAASIGNGNRGLSACIGTDKPDLVVGERSCRNRSSALLDRFPLVLKVGAISEVVDVDTGRIVAGMENVELTGTVVMLHDDTMGQSGSTVGDTHKAITLDVRADVQQTIAIRDRSGHHPLVRSHGVGQTFPDWGEPSSGPHLHVMGGAEILTVGGTVASFVIACHGERIP